ncbi:hypothetical protein DB42_BP00490 [Neochlamydia sp. EPS4]|nr:hypothetical protein DB42_BP00490 [Neochlamydia sp. EPS4]
MIIKFKFLYAFCHTYLKIYEESFNVMKDYYYLIVIHLIKKKWENDLFLGRSILVLPRKIKKAFLLFYSKPKT